MEIENKIPETNDPNLWSEVWTKVSGIPQEVSDNIAKCALAMIDDWYQSRPVNYITQYPAESSKDTDHP